MKIETAEKLFKEWIEHNPKSKTAIEANNIIKKYNLFAKQDKESANADT